jgi:Flp pilus assembly CpaE family ATPase
MLVTCWSVKGGSGTTVVAAALAVLLARRMPGEVLLVDVGGDAPAALGLPDLGGPGVLDWLSAGPPGLEPEALRRLEVEAGSGLRLLPRGSMSSASASASAFGGHGVERLLEAVADRAAVVVDAGPSSPFAFDLAAGATVSLLVLRPCYLALRRALAAPVRPSAVVVIEEVGRALDPTDIEDVLGVPVRAVIPWDAAIARCVDAGLLGARLPRPLAAALRRAA